MKKVKIEAGIAYYYNPEKKKNEVIGAEIKIKLF